MRRCLAAVLAVVLAAPTSAQTPDRLGDDLLRPGRLDTPEAASNQAALRPPDSFAFQGVLADGGQPVADGTHAVAIRLFDEPSGGTPRYAEDHTVQTIGGVFALSVGAGTPTSGELGFVNFSEAVYVEVAVGGTRLSPRTAIEPAPVARTLAAGATINTDQPISIRTSGRTAVQAISQMPSGRGVEAFVFASGNTTGVRGQVVSSSGRGIYGIASASTGATYGVYGEVNSPDGFPGYFTGGRGLRVRTASPVYPSDLALRGEDLVVEAADAVLGLYSTDGGTWGSALVFGELFGDGASGGDIRNKWAVARRTGETGGLFFTYGLSPNYATNDAQMRIDTDGSVHADDAFVGGGADLAEFFPLAEGAAVAPGDLVGVRGGRVSLATEGAEQVMIASSDPAFVGNPNAEAGGALVALVGQAEVRLVGDAAPGDLLVASGRDDGTARAVAPEAYRPEGDGPVAGRVLSAEGGVAVALVGVDEAAALRAVVAAQAAEHAAQRAEIDALRADLDAVLARLDALAPTSPTASAR